MFEHNTLPADPSSVRVELEPSTRRSERTVGSLRGANPSNAAEPLYRDISADRTFRLCCG